MRATDGYNERGIFFQDERMILIIIIGEIVFSGGF